MKKRNFKIVSEVQPPVKVVKTRETKARESLEEICHTIDYNLRSTEKDLEAWAVRFQKNASYAFEWSSSAFEAAGRQQAAKHVKAIVDHLRTPEDEYSAKTDEQILRIVHKELYETVMRKAKWPDHSTSVPSNEMSLKLNSAYAELLEKCDWAIARIERE